MVAVWNDASSLSIGLPRAQPVTAKSCSTGLTQNASVTASAYCNILITTASMPHSHIHDHTEHLGCVFATNGGYFGGQPVNCVGNYVANGTVLQLQNAPATNAAFLKNGSMIFGYADTHALQGLASSSSQLVSGKGWLVRRGAVHWNASQDLRHPSPFAEEFVPRTALGVLKNGSMLLLVVSGIELAHVGVSLQELSEMLVQMGAWQAVNLDGGGSSDAVFKGAVVSAPTCSDTSHVCERPIVSIMCVGEHKAAAGDKPHGKIFEQM